MCPYARARNTRTRTRREEKPSRSLRSRSKSPIPSDAPPLMRQDSSRSLRSRSRPPIPSAPPPHSHQSPRSLRSLGLPASYAQRKPLHSVCRARETAAQSYIHLPRPQIPSAPPPTRSLRSLVAAPCRKSAHVSGDALG